VRRIVERSLPVAPLTTAQTQAGTGARPARARSRRCALPPDSSSHPPTIVRPQSMPTAADVARRLSLGRHRAPRRVAQRRRLARLAALVAAAAAVGLLLVREASAAVVIAGLTVPSNVAGGALVTPEELSRRRGGAADGSGGGDGSNGGADGGKDDDGPVWLAVLGHVFDATKGRRHYGPGGPYEALAGRDATRAFVTGEGLGVFSSLSGQFSAFLPGREDAGSDEKAERTAPPPSDSLEDLPPSAAMEALGWLAFYHARSGGDECWRRLRGGEGDEGEEGEGAEGMASTLEGGGCSPSGPGKYPRLGVVAGGVWFDAEGRPRHEAWAALEADAEAEAARREAASWRAWLPRWARGPRPASSGGAGGASSAGLAAAAGVGDAERGDTEGGDTEGGDTEGGDTEGGDAGRGPAPTVVDGGAPVRPDLDLLPPCVSRWEGNDSRTDDDDVAVLACPFRPAREASADGSRAARPALPRGVPRRILRAPGDRFDATCRCLPPGAPAVWPPAGDADSTWRGEAAEALRAALAAWRGEGPGGVWEPWGPGGGCEGEEEECSWTGKDGVPREDRAPAADGDDRVEL